MGMDFYKMHYEAINLPIINGSQSNSFEFLEDIATPSDQPHYYLTEEDIEALELKAKTEEEKELVKAIKKILDDEGYFEFGFV